MGKRGSTLLLIASFSESIIKFRGPLIAGLLESGFRVHVAAPGLEPDSPVALRLAEMGVAMHDIPMSRAGTSALADARLVLTLANLMRSVRPEYTLAYTIKPVVYGTIAAWLAQVPRRFALITGLGYAFTGARKGLLTRIVMRLYALALKRASKVFFQNPDDERQFREMGLLPIGIPSVVVNGSGVDLASYTVQPLPAGAPIFLMIGRLLGDKGVREYAQAAQRIRAVNADVRFRLVGWIDSNPDAITQSELDAWISDGTLEFLGKLDDVRLAIAESTVYVLPSYREGTPRTVLEAMAMGRPIITTDAPGCRETMIDGENGYLGPVKSVDALVAAMQRFIDNPDLAARMGQRSRQIAEDKYDVHKVNAVMLREMGITGSDTGKEMQA